MLGIPYARQDWIDPEIAKAAARDPFGHRCHLLFGLIWFLLLPGPMSAVEVAGVGIWATCVFRAYYIHRTWRSFGCHPLLWMIAAWVGWQALSLTWSPDPHAGMLEVRQNRWVWIMWMAWAILPHRSAMIAALVAGFLIANLAQLLRGAGFDWMTSNRAPDRNSGWWQPVVGGSMLTAALGLHLPAAVMGTGWPRRAGLAGSAVTLAGVIATGARGAWIAAAGLIVVVLGVALARGLGWSRTSETAALRARPARRLAVLSVALAVSLGATWLAAGGAMTRRFDQGREEVRRALVSRDYKSWTGFRIYMLIRAWEEFSLHPVRGVGAGGYQKWAIEHRPSDDTEGYVHEHAHNMIAHIAATTGLVGLSLFSAAIVMGLRGAFAGLGDKMGTYAAGPGFALIGLMLAGITDVVHLNAQTAALLFALLGLCIRPRPRETGLPRGPWGRPFPK